MMGWDTPAPAPAAAAPDPIFGEQTITPTPLAAPAPVVPEVETVSEDEPDVPAADPFANAGLLSDMIDKPLTTFERSSKFELGGQEMAPLPITTAQFGQQWGNCPATNSISLTSAKVSSLDQFMAVCSEVGGHQVESIPATNEGICAGMFDGGSKVILIHGKVAPSPGGANITGTIKSTDTTVGGTFAMYLQTMLR